MARDELMRGWIVIRTILSGSLQSVPNYETQNSATDSHHAGSSALHIGIDLPLSIALWVMLFNLVDAYKL